MSTETILLHNTKASAIGMDEFHRQLREFARGSRKTVGDAPRGQTSWTWVKRLGNRYYLNSDASRSGVTAYLRLVDELGEDLKWSVVANERGKKNKVAFGPEHTVIEGFYFYRDVD